MTRRGRRRTALIALSVALAPGAGIAPAAGTATAPAPAAASVQQAVTPRWSASVSAISPALKKRMAPSWRAGCPVPRRDLAYVRVRYWGFDGTGRHIGELVVAKAAAPQVVASFKRLYQKRFPIRQMRLVDDFGASDARSMAADNTSAFNCRRTASGRWSAHSYGTAIDINPRENPHVLSSGVLPPNGAPWAYQRSGKGVITRGGPVVAAFSAIGWYWGGNYRSPDYQHFSESGL